jgi:NAD(P)-dependent dehydrogenase (short-subunit alcohol dehydrogenase family)
MNGEVMKIFLAGASGAIGSQLVPQLAAGGHEVVGTTRSAAKTGALLVLGAKPPRRVPAWLVGLLTGKGPVNMMTRPAGSPTRTPNANWTGRRSARVGARASLRD